MALLPPVCRKEARKRDTFGLLIKSSTRGSNNTMIIAIPISVFRMLIWILRFSGVLFQCRGNGKKNKRPKTDSYFFGSITK
jgi:hypothetical protein